MSTHSISMMRLERESSSRDEQVRGRSNTSSRSRSDDDDASVFDSASRAFAFDVQKVVRVARWIAIALLISAVVALGYLGVRTVGRLPIEQVRFVGDIRLEDRMDNAELERLAKDLKGASGTFGGADISAMQTAVRRVPWVRDATVRRRFPNALEVRVEAHRPVARWGETDLVNSHGERFNAATTEALPKLSGPDGSTYEVAQHFSEFQKLARSSGNEVDEVVLTNRRAWQVKLRSGPWVELGRTDEKTRLVRALALTEFLPQIATASHIDARYAQGVAVRK
jgi:cell division protein FtsQ